MTSAAFFFPDGASDAITIKIGSQGHMIKFCSVSSHIGIDSNKWAYLNAAQADSGQTKKVNMPHRVCMKLMHHKLEDKWQASWITFIEVILCHLQIRNTLLTRNLILVKEDKLILKMQRWAHNKPHLTVMYRTQATAKKDILVLQRTDSFPPPACS